jgi:hypothetical protein
MLLLEWSEKERWYIWPLHMGVAKVPVCNQKGAWSTAGTATVAYFSRLGAPKALYGSLSAYDGNSTMHGVSH